MNRTWSRLVALALAGCGASTPASVAGPELELELTYTTGENSRDSHESEYQFTVREGRLEFSGPYGECVRGLCDHKRVSLQLTEAELRDLAKRVDELTLPASFEVKGSSAEMGTFARMTLSLTRDGRVRSRLSVEGMTTSWKEQETELLGEEARQVLSTTRGFVMVLKEIAAREQVFH